MSGQALAQYDLNGAGFANFATDFNVPINVEGVQTGDYNFCNVVGFCGSGSTTARLDTQVPITTITPSGWNNAAFNMTLSCTDVTSGCMTTTYRLDTDPSATIAYGIWNIYVAPIPMAADGNYAIDFNSIDVAGNMETLQTAYLLIDTSIPTMDVNYPVVVVNNTNGNVQVTTSATDLLSGILGYWYSIITGVWTWSTNPTHTFTSVPNGDYNVMVIATDNADNNSATSIVPITVNVPSPPAGPTGGSTGSSSYSGGVSGTPLNQNETDEDTGSTGGESGLPICSSDNLSACTGQSECENLGGTWENNACVSTPIIPKEPEIILLPGDLRISDANPQGVGAGLFGLGGQESTVIGFVLVLIVLIILGVFLTATTTGQEIVKGFKK